MIEELDEFIEETMEEEEAPRDPGSRDGTILGFILWITVATIILTSLHKGWVEPLLLVLPLGMIALVVSAHPDLPGRLWDSIRRHGGSDEDPADLPD